MTSNSHKDQHTVPECYLKEWCDPDTPEKHDPYLWIFDKDGSNSKKRAPKNVFSEKDFYTVEGPDGDRDITLELKLSEWEYRFTKIRREKLERWLPLSAEEHAYLMIFVAAADFRTRPSRDHHASPFQNLLKRYDELEAKLKTATPEELDQWANLAPIGSTPSSENVRELARNPIPALMPIMLRITIRHLDQMNMTIFSTDDPIGFITSDAPVVVVDPRKSGFPPPWNTPGLASRTVEVVMPISPRQCLLLTREDLQTGHLKASQSFVDEVNRWQRFSCGQHFIVRRNELKDNWFSPESVLLP